MLEDVAVTPREWVLGCPHVDVSISLATKER